MSGPSTSRPVDQDYVVTYLNALLAKLASDLRVPWLSGHAAAAVDIARRLQAESGMNSDFDALTLAKQSRRLVVLGGPGSGKTWLAITVARRCAQEALESLARGEPLDEVELPLYAPCFRLSDSGADIWDAVASSAVDHLGEQLDPWAGIALRAFLADRTSASLLILDALNETHSADNRVRQLDLLPWRVFLTSRPTSWHHQLPMIQEHGDNVAVLQPFRYPDEVEAYIERWFAGQEEPGADLSGQIADSPSLQETVSSPLFLAFCCIASNEVPLPANRHELCRAALKNVIVSFLRDANHQDIDVNSCLFDLRSLAWRGATAHPDSGIGTWAEEISVPAQSRLRCPDVFDQFTSPLESSVDPASGERLRRFCHRTVREHLVAEHIASLPVDKTVTQLLSHIWFDIDWEYSAPAALAMHPSRDQVLREIISRLRFSGRLSQIGAAVTLTAHFRRFLSRVAMETGETDWPSPDANIIGQARAEFAVSGHPADFEKTRQWPTSDSHSRRAIVALLQRADSENAVRLASLIAKLNPTADDMKHVRHALLGLLRRERGVNAVALAGSLAGLQPTPIDLESARKALDALLSPYAPVLRVVSVADALSLLDPTEDQSHRVEQILIERLGKEDNTDDIATLAVAALRWSRAGSGREKVAGALLAALARDTDQGGIADLAAATDLLCLTPERLNELREELLDRLDREESSGPAIGLADALSRLHPTAAQLRRGRSSILRVLAHETLAFAPAELANMLTRLNPSAGDLLQARGALLELLSPKPPALTAWRLAYELARLRPSREDQRQGCEALLMLLEQEADGRSASRLADVLALLTTAPKDRRQARSTLLRLLKTESDAASCALLATTIAELRPTLDELRQARHWLASKRPTGYAEARSLSAAAAQMHPTVQDLASWPASWSQDSDELLVAIRHSTPITAWLSALSAPA